MSSSPGWLSSVDDFYLTGADLGVIETTNGLNNRALLEKVTPQGGLMSWVRVMAANYLATDGKTWSDVFSKQNGGTYNNQWFVIDMKKFKPGAALQDDLLWVLEQLPGYVHADDQTGFLRRMGYWPSYNAPFYRDIANMSHMLDAWTSAPRHFLFQRNATMVHDLQSFGELMRYNNYRHDPLSHGSPMQAIMARGDLAGAISEGCASITEAALLPQRASVCLSAVVPPTAVAPLTAVSDCTAGELAGGIDSKITSYKMSAGGKRIALAMNGPTHSQLPPFAWRSAQQPPLHVGQPTTWDFDYETMDPAAGLAGHAGPAPWRS
jgi:hypothetical protein